MHEVEIGKGYFILTPVWFYVGEVEAVTVFGVRLKPGASEIHLLNDQSTFLSEGILAEGDELVPLPNGTLIPSLWVGPATPFPFPLTFGRTHDKVAKKK